MMFICFFEGRVELKEPNQFHILVTGGAGFLGSHLCERLLKEGQDVVFVDNFYTGSKRNIQHLLQNPFFELLCHDITFHLYVEVDRVYNLACPAAPIHYQFDPVQTTKVNVHGFINMLGLAKRLKARILQASTSEVYGDPTVHPQPEIYVGSVNPVGPRACYDEGKRCAETLFFDYYRQYGVKIKVARIFNTYGPRMPPNDAITGPINLGNPEEITMLELANKIIKLTNSPSEIIFRPLPADDPNQRKPDITLAREKLGWAPHVSLEEGLQKTIAYFDALLRDSY